MENADYKANRYRSCCRIRLASLSKNTKQVNPICISFLVASAFGRGESSFSNLDDIFIRQRFVRLVVLGVLEQHLVHVGRRILVESIGTAEDDQSDLAIAQHRQFVSFLHHAKLALVERHLFIINFCQKKKIFGCCCFNSGRKSNQQSIMKITIKSHTV